MNPLNVLYLINYSGNGGTERYIESLIEALGPRINPHVLYNIPGDFSEKMQRLGVPCEQLTLKSPFDFAAAKSLAKKCREWKIDLIHTQFLREDFIADFSRLVYCSSAAHVSTVHMIDPKTGLAATFNRLLSRLRHTTIAVSGIVLQNLRAERLYNPTLIYNGVTLPDGGTSGDDGEVTLGSAGNCRTDGDSPLTVFCAGRLSAEKGQIHLINAAKSLPRLRFVFAGNGPLLDEWSAAAPDNCEFLGFVADRDRLGALYGECDVYCCPSEQEALPLSVLEAMSHGKCLVVTNVGGLPEIIDDSCGRVVAPKSPEALTAALREVCEDAPLRKALGEAARRRVISDFSIERCAEATYATYLAAVKKTRAAAE